MKINQPVTNNERVLEEDQVIVSKTDLEGTITYANRDFIQMSGFSEKELLGENHNIVRHPDMPPVAFQDLWDTLSAGKPWTGVVKNRCKNGDFYWVQANVTPVRQDGRVVEFMSVRTKPSRDQIEEAEALYRQVNAGTASLGPSRITRAFRLWSDMRLWLKGTLTVGMLLLPALVLGAVIALEPGIDPSRKLSMLLGAGIFALVAGGAGFALFRMVTKGVSNAASLLNAIAEGNYKNPVPASGDDEIGDLLRAIHSMQIQFGYDIHEARRLASKSDRIRTALDNVSANVMVADPEHNIIYTNKSLTQMFLAAQDDLRKDLPQFDAEKLIGTNMDIFHKNPADQRKMIEGLSGRHESEFAVGGRQLRVIANPVVDAAGNRLGTAVEWADRTQEVALEQEVGAIVDAARDGDLSQRIAIEGKSGFFEQLSHGINDLVAFNEDVVNDTVRVVGALARGDLSERIEAQYEGAFGQLKSEVNANLDKLTEVIGKIKGSARAVGTATAEISHGNANLSQRTEAQASSLEETASSMEQMTSTVKQNADNARQANQLAAGAREQAEQGGDVVGRAVGAMGEINTSSKKIADIIGVIDEIAFQTNLLALNAAVEAARAGEQGRGFAVVAGEVRSLASRSAAAAKEIKTLIQDSVAKVDEGSRLVDESGETLSEIVNAVKKVSDIIAEIAAASQEQSAGIDQVNRAIMQMDETTQQNAALVEEAAAASEALGEQAQNLTGFTAFFKTSEGEEVTEERVERRGPNRPWSSAPAPTTVTEPQQVEVKATGTDGMAETQSAAAPKPSAGGDEEEWEEF